MLALNHKNLNVWKRSTELTVGIYAITENFPTSELYGIVSQLRRAAVSVPSNIAEGASRSSNKDRARFYEIARSSLVEIDTQLEITLRLQYFSTNEVEVLNQLLNEVFAMLSTLIKNTSREI